MTIGEKFKSVRKAKGLTLADVVKALKLKSTGHLSQIERGEKEPSPTLIDHFKLIFSISEKWWASGEGEMFSLSQSEEKQGIRDENSAYFATLDERKIVLNTLTAELSNFSKAKFYKAVSRFYAIIEEIKEEER